MNSLRSINKVPQRSNCSTLWRWFLCALVWLAISTATHASSTDQTQQFLRLYDGLLERYVSPARLGEIAFASVDYDRWANDPNHSKALQLLQEGGPPKQAAPEEWMSWWINAYNFLTLDLIIREGERDSIRNLGTFFTNVWNRYRWNLGGEDYTLDQIEHDILRPLGDPRIHFAINCAAISCPDLQGRAYRGENLNEALEAATLAALDNSSKILRIESETVWLSRIFDWFEQDFANGNLHEWLGRYRHLPADATIRFLSYDWSLNKPVVE